VCELEKKTHERYQNISMTKSVSVYQKYLVVCGVIYKIELHLKNANKKLRNGPEMIWFPMEKSC
jgi:hypothetical protein